MSKTAVPLLALVYRKVLLKVKMEDIDSIDTVNNQGWWFKRAFEPSSLTHTFLSLYQHNYYGYYDSSDKILNDTDLAIIVVVIPVLSSSICYVPVSLQMTNLKNSLICGDAGDAEYIVKLIIMSNEEC